MNKHVTIGQLETALKKSRLSVAELSEAIIEALEEVAAKSDSTESDLSEELSKKQTAGESVKINTDGEIIFSTGVTYENDILDSADDNVLDSAEEAIQSSTPIDEADEPNIIFDKETLTLIIDGKQFGLKLKSDKEIIFEAENVTAENITADVMTANSLNVNGVDIQEKISELEDDTALNNLADEISKKQTAGESVKINSEEKIIFSTDYSYTENLLDSDGNEILDSNEESILSNGPIEEADEPNVIFDKETSTLIIDGKQFSLKLKTEGEIAFEAENITASSITINGVNVWDKLTELEDRIAFLETDADTNPYYDVDI